MLLLTRLWPMRNHHGVKPSQNINGLINQYQRPPMFEAYGH